MSSVMLVLIRPPSFAGRRRDCLLFWLAVAITFGVLNSVDSRSGEFKIDRVSALETARTPAWRRSFRRE